MSIFTFNTFKTFQFVQVTYIFYSHPNMCMEDDQGHWEKKGLGLGIEKKVRILKKSQNAEEKLVILRKKWQFWGEKSQNFFPVAPINPLYRWTNPEK